MEKWNEVFKGKIPEGLYAVELSFGEKNGLIVQLYNKNTLIEIDFGVVKAVRILEEGVVIDGVYLEDEVQKYKKDGFINTIYEIKEGEFKKQIELMLGNYLEFYCLKHYILVTMNYNIEIVTEWEPTIRVLY